MLFADSMADLAWEGDSAAACAACQQKLNKHARKIDNIGPLNLNSCFGVNVAAEKVWLCSGCRRNFGSVPVPYH